MRSDRPLLGVTVAAALAVMPANAAPPGFVPQSEKAEIVRLRQANNDAIAARDLAGTLQMLADNYVAVGGNDGIIRSKDEAHTLWSKDFALEHPFNRCVRRPAQIELGKSGGVLRAAESGIWSCAAETERGPNVAQGRYFAHWSKRSGAWKVVSDNYVTLECRGSGCPPN